MIVSVSRHIAQQLRRGNKILIFGNGGSAADAQHIAAEFVNRLTIPERPAIPALALTTDSSILTSIANDFSFEFIFSRQLEAFGNPGDIALGISTSGNSGNVVKAMESAHEKNLITVAFLGGNGGKLKNLVEYPLIVNSTSAQHVQETHITLAHAVCEAVERALFPE